MAAIFNRKLVRCYLYMILSICSAGFPFVFPGWVSLLEAENYASGDLDCNQNTGLSDAILVLRLVSSIPVTSGFCFSDVNKDGKIGLEEEIYILQTIAGLRSSSNPTDIYDQARRQCVDAINAYRATLSLPPLQRWTDAESCADTQAQTDSGATPHSAYGRCGEYAQNECTYGWYSTDAVITGCLDMMWQEGPGTDYATHGHYLAMSNRYYTQVACGFYQASSGVWSVQNFR